MKLSELTPHPQNSSIYSPTDLDDLKSSLTNFGQLEPIAITKKDKIIISGHRRFAAMRSLGWDECEIRFVEPDNEIIALIEHNKQRQKTKQDILNEARFLEKELKEMIGRGRNATLNRDGKKKGKRTTYDAEVATRLGLGTTQWKQLKSISNYQPELVQKIDKGELSVSAAYKLVREENIKPRTEQTNPMEQEGWFQFQFKKFLKSQNQKPKLSEIQNVLRDTFPYSLEMTDVDVNKREDLVRQLDRLKQFDSRELMLFNKQYELENLEVSPKDLAAAKVLLPSYDELNEFFRNNLAVFDVKLVVADGSYTCKKTKRTFSKQLWNIFRVCISSHEHLEGPGRKMSAFVGFENQNGFRILGILAFASDSHSLGVRDEHIGWTSSQRTKNREHIVNMNVCVPSQPFGTNRLGGKFLAMFVEELVSVWEQQYGDKIVGITTTSLHGSQSQYNGMKWWKHLGSSAGAMVIAPLRDDWDFWRTWLRENHPDAYDDARKRTSPKQALTREVFKRLEINPKDYEHNHKRGVFFRPLYSNYRDFLCDEIKETQLVESDNNWNDWWLGKMRKRVKDLIIRQEISTETLFHDFIDKDELEMWLSSRGVG